MSHLLCHKVSDQSFSLTANIHHRGQWATYAGQYAGFKMHLPLMKQPLNKVSISLEKEANASIYVIHLPPDFCFHTIYM